MSCYATADNPPVYVQFEGSFIVGVKPTDPSKCQKLKETLKQLQESNCAKQGLVWNGDKCVSKPIYQQIWFWAIVMAALFGAALLVAIASKQSNPFVAYV